MRTIKFKAWSKNREQMFDVVKISFISGAVWFNNSAYIGNLGERDIVLLQFTGLLDKNGKEIFEGDIVHDHHILSAGKVCEVYYEAPSFYVKGSGGDWIMNRYNPQGYEVIGNVYENSSLLKEINQ